MLDIKFIKSNPGVLDEAMRKRNKEPIEETLLKSEKKYKDLITRQQNLLEERNKLTKQFELSKKSGSDTYEIGMQMESLKNELSVLKADLFESENEFFEIMSSIPNIPHQDCPVGKDEEDDLEIRRFGNVQQFDFTPLEHFELGEKNGMMDFKKSASVAGSRFVFLFGKLARLERCIAQFMLDVHTKEYGYIEVYPPLILNKESMFGVGQLPKFEEDLFKTTLGSYLIPTAEACLTNINRDSIINESELPIRLTAYTPCFRSESGAAGKDTKGMIRQHQFGKVELVSIVSQDSEESEHERMTEAAESILKKLKLPFRTVLLCTGSMGFSSAKTYDIEVWLSGQGGYREISSCSRCGTFQARRMNTRYNDSKSGQKLFVCTLNGSGLAVGRCLIAIMENNQRKDGSIKIPEALIPYFGEEQIKPQT